MTRSSASKKYLRSESETLTWIIGICVVSITALAIGGLLYLNATTAKPRLDKQTLCPIDGGAQSATVVLLDTSDQWPEITREEVRKRLEDLAADVPYYGLLELRLLDPSVPGGRMMFEKCNPGNGVDESDITSNPRQMRKRWKQQFLTPLQQALDNTLTQSETASSPILATAQRISVDRFNDEQPGHLVLISDMMEFTSDYSQYNKGDLSYERYKGSAAYKKQHTDLHGADVTIFYVQRLGIDSGKHIQFWIDWIADNNGSAKELEKLQGAG